MKLTWKLVEYNTPPSAARPAPITHTINTTSTSFQVNFMEGQQLLLLMFAGITLGGLGTSFGAAAGCFVLGLAIQMSTLYIPTSLRNVGALAVLIVVLMFAPQGIFGRRERVG